MELHSFLADSTGQNRRSFENDKISAALFCLGIPSVAKQLEGVPAVTVLTPRFPAIRRLEGSFDL